MKRRIIEKLITSGKFTTGELLVVIEALNKDIKEKYNVREYKETKEKKSQ